MKVDLSEVLTDLWRKRKTGLFSLSVHDSNRLFKIFLKEGEVYRISFGNLRGPGCLPLFDELDFKSSFFLPSIELAGERENIPQTPDLISLFKITGKLIDLKKYDHKVSSSSNNEPINNVNRVLDELQAALVEQVGPAGLKAFKRIVEEKWQSVSSPTKEDIQLLVNLLKDLIEDTKDRHIFVVAANRLLSL